MTKPGRLSSNAIDVNVDRKSDITTGPFDRGQAERLLYDTPNPTKKLKLSKLYPTGHRCVCSKMQTAARVTSSALTPSCNGQRRDLGPRSCEMHRIPGEWRTRKEQGCY